MPVGLEKMAELAYKEQNALRPPKPEEVAEAFTDFFTLRKGPFEEFHIATAHLAFKYLLANPQENGQPWVSNEVLDSDILEEMMRQSRRPEVVGKAHMAFGRAILDELASILEREEKDTQAETTAGRMELSHDVNLKTKLIRLSSLFGSAVEARNIVADAFQDDPKAISQGSPDLWDAVLAGIAREGNVEEMLKTTEMWETQAIPLSRMMQERLVLFFCEKGDLDRARFWYAQPIATRADQETIPPTGKTSCVLLTASAMNGDLSYGQKVVAAMLKDDVPRKEYWDAILVWSAAIGKGVDEVDRMMNVLMRRNEEARQKDPTVESIRPDIHTIHALVELAMSKQDPYTAERYVALGERRGILPDQRTFTMQMEYRLAVEDLDGAKTAYFNLMSSFDGADPSVLVVNKLIHALCKSKQHHFDDLMAIVDDLHERRADFTAETVAALTLLHLQRGEIHDAMDLLQVHAHQYAPAQRRVIQNALSAFILDGDTSTADAWDGYQILRSVFADTPRSDRVTIMNNFFTRNRPDMGCHVFFHMRHHVSKAHSANIDVYVAAFTGFARCADSESLDLAYNQLKLDFDVEMNTRLRNSLMLAYAAAGQNDRALQFWTQVCESKEGPSYNSIPIAFRCCEGKHWGGEHATSIWKRLQEQDVEINKPIWTAYLAAMTRNHHHKEALALIENVEADYGFAPDVHVYVEQPPQSFILACANQENSLATWFNMTASSEKQLHVEAWIRDHYPDLWSDIEALGYWVTMDGLGYRQYNINRNLEP